MFRKKSKSRSPEERKRGPGEEEEYKDRERDKPDEQRDLLQLLNKVIRDEDEEEKEDVKQMPFLHGTSRDISPAPARPATSFSDIAGGTQRSRFENPFQEVKSAADLEKMDFRMARAGAGASFAQTARRADIPMRMEFSPQKRREQRQKIVEGGDKLLKNLETHLWREGGRKWIRLHKERLQWAKQTVSRVQALRDRLLLKVCLSALRRNRAEKKKEKNDASKAASWVKGRERLKAKYVLHKLRGFARAQRAWLKRTQAYFRLEQSRHLFQRFHEHRNLSLAEKHLHRRLLQRVLAKAWRPFVQEARLQHRRALAHWAWNREDRALHALRWYRSLRRLKHARKTKANAHRRSEVLNGVLGVWRSKLRELQAIKADKIMR